MSATRYVIIDGKNISRRWLEQHHGAYPGFDRGSLKTAGPEEIASTPVTPAELLISRLDRMMGEASRLAGAIKTELGDHPATYAMNRAWLSLGTARDVLTKI